MQKREYENAASAWSLGNRDPVVGAYDAHNHFPEYDELLFKGLDLTDCVALEYGAGPGRNMIRFSGLFKRIDGCDISEGNKKNAYINLEHAQVPAGNYYVTTGDNIPTEDNTYDVVFSVICLQHICSYDIRKKIITDILRVLKPGGKFCAQLGYGGKHGHIPFVTYFENVYTDDATNGYRDVSITNEQDLIDDLKDIGFINYRSEISRVGPGDTHLEWLWFIVEKPL